MESQDFRNERTHFLLFHLRFVSEIFRLAEFIACLSLVGYKDVNHILLGSALYSQMWRIVKV